MSDALMVRASLVVVCLAHSATAQPPQVLDDFSDGSRWSVVASEGVRLGAHENREAAGPHASTLRLDLDFVSGGGYAGIRRKLPLDLPGNFELAFALRGDLPRNNLEVKLVDATGESVWWVNRRGFDFPRKWTRLASRRRHFQFAWGPSNSPIQRASAIEIIVASAEGGRGSIFLDDLAFRPLPETRPYTGTPKLSSSSQADPERAARNALDKNADTAWQSAPGDRKPVLTMDFGAPREFGGLVINWDPKAYAARYDIQFSDDAKHWTTARAVRAGSGRTQFISLPDSETRALRLAIEQPRGGEHVAVREIEILPLEAARDGNAFAAIVARRSPRGYYPRAMLGEGTFWTVIGAPADDREALISEDGAVEVDKQSFSIEPFLYVDGRLLTWADAKTDQSLAAGHAPVPTVVREYDGLSLSVTAAADGQRDASAALLLYTVFNKSTKPVAGSLLLAIRPFQVNPPYQWLNTVGGVSKIGRIRRGAEPRILAVDDREIAFGIAANAFGSAVFDEGDVTSFLSEGQMPPHDEVSDPQQAASAAVRYTFHLDPRQSRPWAVCVPLSRNGGRAIRSLLTSGDPARHVRRRQRIVAENWIAATSMFELLVPTEATEIVDTIRSTLAYILINRDGAGIQPGSRSYERSWIRDGSLTAAALLRFGLEREAREFVDWYAPYQFESGKVPCVVDRRGPDPVPENDSHGQFIMAVMNIYRFHGDENFLRKHWPRVKKAVAYIQKLRGERMTAAYSDPRTTATHQEPGKPPVSLHAFHGLVPESISHEGYSAKPMHSYWDDFFTLRGLKDAAEMAHILGETEAGPYQALAEDFAVTLYRSIGLAMRAHNIDYLPGCVELGDFDATSTTIALWPCGELERLPRPALDRTFDLYWERFVARRDDPHFAWTDYTPYELRCVGSLILLGRPERAHEALAFFMRDRRPPGWRQWPEVVHREPRAPRFLGDLPHTWCGSDFLNSVRMMFLYEREADEAIVLLAGVPKSWISSRPVGFKNMPTHGGKLSCTIERASGGGNQLIAHITGTRPIPDGGLRLTSPLGPVDRAGLNGQPAEIDRDGRVVVRSLPAIIELY
jgi:hypothetical protein